jgi:glycosyltransferase involved in cell wall biosynthesis
MKSSNKPDIVHVHGYPTLMTPIGSDTLEGVGIPVVFSPHPGVRSHGTIFGNRPSFFYDELTKYSFSIPDAVVCASRFEARWIEKCFKAPNSKVFVISHGVQAVHPLPAHRFLVQDGKLILLFAGSRLEPKGVEYVINALSILRKEHGVNASLLIIGDGPFPSQQVELAYRLGVAACITLRSTQKSDTLEDIYAECGLLSLLSQSENFELAVSRPLAVGTPLIECWRLAEPLHVK